MGWKDFSLLGVTVIGIVIETDHHCFFESLRGMLKKVVRRNVIERLVRKGAVNGSTSLQVRNFAIVLEGDLGSSPLTISKSYSRKDLQERYFSTFTIDTKTKADYDHQAQELSNILKEFRANNLSPNGVLEKLINLPTTSFYYSSNDDWKDFFFHFSKSTQIRMYKSPLLSQFFNKFILSLSERFELQLINEFHLLNLLVISGRSLGLHYELIKDHNYRQLLDKMIQQLYKKHYIYSNFHIYSLFFACIGSIHYPWTSIPFKERRQILFRMREIDDSLSSIDMTQMELLVYGWNQLKIGSKSDLDSNLDFVTPETRLFVKNLFLAFIKDSYCNSQKIRRRYLFRIISLLEFAKIDYRSLLDSKSIIHLYEGLRFEWKNLSFFEMCLSMLKLGEVLRDQKIIPSDIWKMMISEIQNGLIERPDQSLAEFSMLIQGLSLLNCKVETIGGDFLQVYLSSLQNAVGRAKKDQLSFGMINILVHLSKIGCKWETFSPELRKLFVDDIAPTLQRQNLSLGMIGDYFTAIGTSGLKWNSISSQSQSDLLAAAERGLLDSNGRNTTPSSLIRLLTGCRTLDYSWVENSSFSAKVMKKLELIFEEKTSNGGFAISDLELSYFPRLFSLLADFQVKWSLIPESTQDSLSNALNSMTNETFRLSGAIVSKILNSLMRMNTKEDLLTLDVKRNLFLAIDLSVKPPKRLFFEDAVEMIMALSKMKFKWIHIPSTTQDILVRTLRNRNDLNSLSNENLIRLLLSWVYLGFDCIDEGTQEIYSEVHKELLAAFSQRISGLSKWSEKETNQLALYFEWAATLPTSHSLSLPATNLKELPSIVEASMEESLLASNILLALKQQFHQDLRLENIKVFPNFHYLKSKLLPVSVAVEYKGKVISFLQISDDQESRSDELREYFLNHYFRDVPVWKVNRKFVSNEKELVDVSLECSRVLFAMLDDIDSGRLE